VAETDMSGYKSDLIARIEQNVDHLVKDVLRPENAPYNDRHEALKGDPDPKRKTTSKDDNTTKLLPGSGNTKYGLNNNPLFPVNMIDALNTPFDHVERIVLQDFSSILFNGENNYFKDLFTFNYKGNNAYEGVSSFVIPDSARLWPKYMSYGCINEKFGPGVTGHGGFLVDSFTYTPFVDYSQDGEGGDPRIGVYSDQFLNDYNSGKYDDFTFRPEVQYDVNRRSMSQNLY
jgi:hypothetical protein